MRCNHHYHSYTTWKLQYVNVCFLKKYSPKCGEEPLGPRDPDSNKCQSEYCSSNQSDVHRLLSLIFIVIIYKSKNWGPEQSEEEVRCSWNVWICDNPVDEGDVTNDQFSLSKFTLQSWVHTDLNELVHVHFFNIFFSVRYFRTFCSWDWTDLQSVKSMNAVPPPPQTSTEQRLDTRSCYLQNDLLSSLFSEKWIHSMNCGL